MRSTSNRHVERAGTFPGLYTPIEERNKIKGLVVLMHSKVAHNTLRGIVLHTGNSDYDIGHYMETWAADSFTPYHGSVTIDTES